MELGKSMSPTMAHTRSLPHRRHLEARIGAIWCRQCGFEHSRTNTGFFARTMRTSVRPRSGWISRTMSASGAGRHPWPSCAVFREAWPPHRQGEAPCRITSCGEAVAMPRSQSRHRLGGGVALFIRARLPRGPRRRSRPAPPRWISCRRQMTVGRRATQRLLARRGINDPHALHLTLRAQAAGRPPCRRVPSSCTTSEPQPG